MLHSNVLVPTRTITLNPYFLSIAIVAASAVVVGLGWLRELYVFLYGPTTALQFLRLFDVERSLTNWLQPLLLILSSSLLAMIARLAKQDMDPISQRWAGLSCLFLFMSIDETANFDAMGLVAAGNIFIVLGPILITAVVLGAYFARILVVVPPRFAGLFILSAALFVGGAVGLELASQAVAKAWGVTSSYYVVAASLEETLETVGAVIFNIALMEYLRDRWGSLGLISSLKSGSIG